MTEAERRTASILTAAGISQDDVEVILECFYQDGVKLEIEAAEPCRCLTYGDHSMTLKSCTCARIVRSVCVEGIEEGTIQE